MAELQLLTELLALLESHPTAISGRSRGTQTLPDPAPKVNHPPVLPRAAGTCVSILVEIYLKLWGARGGDRVVISGQLVALLTYVARFAEVQTFFQLVWVLFSFSVLSDR